MLEFDFNLDDSFNSPIRHQDENQEMGLMNMFIHKADLTINDRNEPKHQEELKSPLTEKHDLQEQIQNIAAKSPTMEHSRSPGAFEDLERPVNYSKTISSNRPEIIELEEFDGFSPSIGDPNSIFKKHKSPINSEDKEFAAKIDMSKGRVFYDEHRHESIPQKSLESQPQSVEKII